MRTAVCVIVKNEEHHIAEWIIYHLQQGFDAVVVYDNVSSDKTSDLVKEIMQTRDVRLIDWALTTPSYQIEAYNDAIRRFRHEFEWMAFFDSDEYFVPEEGKDLRLILEQNAASSAIALSWAVFGSSGNVQRPEGLLIDAFIYRSDETFGPNKHVKSIVRPDKALCCLNPHAFAVSGIYTDASGSPVKGAEGGVLERPNFAHAKIHHYLVRSKEHWQNKMRRGYHDVLRNEEFFKQYDRNEVQDTSARRFSQSVVEELRRVEARRSAREAVLVTSLPSSALFTEHNTVLCYDHGRKRLFNRKINELEGCDIVLAEVGRRVRLTARSPHGVIEIDPVSCTAARVVADDLCVMRSTSNGLTIEVRGGFYLSAREGGAVVATVRARGSWEIFTPISEAAATDIISLAQSRWALRSPKSAERPSLVEIKRRGEISVGGLTYPIAGNFPLDHKQTFMGNISSFLLVRQGWMIDEYLRYNPLVYYCCFGEGYVTRQLELATSSLSEIGIYDGEVLVLSNAEEVLSSVSADLRGKTHIRIVNAADRLDFLSARMSLARMEDFNDYSPVLYMDLDVIVDRPVETVLLSVLASQKMSAQEEDFNSLSIAEPAGAELFMRDRVDIEGLLGFNSGVVAFSNMAVAARVLSLMQISLEHYTQKNGRSSLYWCDQPMMNYIVRKLGVFQAEPISSATRTLTSLTGEFDPSDACGFVHFWNCDGGAAKVSAMSEYLDYIRSLSFAG